MRNEEFIVVLSSDKTLLVEVDYDVFSSDFYNPSHCEIEILRCVHLLPEDRMQIDYIPSNSERIEIIDDITTQVFNLENSYETE